MNRILLTGPTVEPVTLVDAKRHLAIDFSDHDSMIAVMIQAARRHVEAFTRRSIVRQKWRIYLEGFASEIALAPPPVQEIAQIQYVSATASPQTQTVTSSIYELDKPRQVARLAYDQSWPTPRAQYNAAWIDVWTGYYDPAASPVNVSSLIPADLRFAVLMLVEDLFNNRGRQSEIVLHENQTARALMQPYVVMDL